MLEVPYFFALKRGIMASKINSIVHLFFLAVELFMENMAGNWLNKGCVFLGNYYRLWSCVSNYSKGYFSAHLMHSGDSSLSPIPPSSSEKMMSGFSGI